MSHEIRTPLSAMVGLITLMQEAARGATARNLALLLRSSLDLTRILDDILIFCKGSAGKITPEMQVFDVISAVNDAVTLMSTHSQSRRCGIILFPSEPIFVSADRARIVQVIVNLLSNAVKFSAEEGRVSGSIAVLIERVDSIDATTCIPVPPGSAFASVHLGSVPVKLSRNQTSLDIFASPTSAAASPARPRGFSFASRRGSGGPRRKSSRTAGGAENPGAQPQAQEAVLISVVDSGIGISEEDLHRIFKPFVQAEMSTTRRFGGTGLGLSISSMLVQAMGGNIAIRSIAGRGTEVGVTLVAARKEDLPSLKVRDTLSRSASQSLMRTRSLAQVLSTTGGIVVLDDDRLRLIFFKTQLETAVVCSTFEETRRAVEQAPACVLLLASARPLEGREEEFAEWAKPLNVSLRIPQFALPSRIGEALDQAGVPFTELPASLISVASLVQWLNPVSGFKGFVESSVKLSGASVDKLPANIASDQEEELDLASSSFSMTGSPLRRQRATLSILNHPHLSQAHSTSSRSILRSSNSASSLMSSTSEPSEATSESFADALSEPAGGIPRFASSAAPPPNTVVTVISPPNGRIAPKKSPAAGAQSKDPAAEVSPDDRVALVVDDTPINLLIVTRLCERAGLRVIKASAGQEAVDRFKELVAVLKKPMLVLMDFHMPGMDGFEAVSLIRAIEKRAGATARAAVFGITADTIVSSERVSEAGMDGYFTRPISQTQVADLAAKLGV